VRHFRRYGHFVPLGLHADFTATTSRDILGVRGTATIYHAQVTNYGALPTTIFVCDYFDYAYMHQMMVNYVVERQRSSPDEWQSCPSGANLGRGFFAALLLK
jgi:hypothetical protein